MEQDILDLIRSRRSVRRFTGEEVKAEHLDRILESGRWAPSGLNNQPWRFGIISDAGLKNEISSLTKYSRIVRTAKLLIAVFLDKEKSYHREKDIQGIGACLQNMLLEIHSLGLGGVWLGEIIKSDAEVRRLLGLGEHLELMAVIALGHPSERPRGPGRKALEELIVYGG